MSSTSSLLLFGVLLSIAPPVPPIAEYNNGAGWGEMLLMVPLEVPVDSCVRRSSELEKSMKIVTESCKIVS